MFQNFGLVETSRIIRHGRTMVSKGYGFVKFSEPSQVSLPHSCFVRTLSVQCMDQQPSGGTAQLTASASSWRSVLQVVWNLCRHHALSHPAACVSASSRRAGRLQRLLRAPLCTVQQRSRLKQWQHAKETWQQWRRMAKPVR
jgi:RNA recognition motif. (a.k.a. RRM, RBD, or RNP domain)